MSRLTEIKIVFYGLVAGAGVIIGNILGGWTEDLKTLLIMMGIDFAMGLLIALVWKKSGKSKTGAASSVSAWKGLCRKGAALLFVLIANRLDIMLGVSYVRTAVIFAFMANELISIIENAGIMGVPIPQAISNSVEILKRKAEVTDQTKVTDNQEHP
ncbi:toxin secretion/phage lysis holin [Aequitasia blattaphilus]|uniref:Phage holin family protein n=1 Tax=Aequitasia blattaphilus TaxID=2949332 RepID=A0ABT1ECL5_9FIRM|nr:phage holin family protein [Aequitasia blattaphilus]MCP1103588.1 phage holin family protein [Aequitasia blattaphilus]MCR8616228.1 phage holin family protein [Aequitasia blattaphilus]